MSKVSRGIRNNNPGNIDYNKANNWKGQLPHDPSIESRFCRFESPAYGIRALIALLRTYQRKYGLKTVSGLINRWAPTNENNTGAYINGVAKELGVSPMLRYSPALNEKVEVAKPYGIFKPVDNEQGDFQFHPYLLSDVSLEFEEALY